MYLLNIVLLVAVGLVATADSAHALFGYCFENDKCAGSGIPVGSAGATPDFCYSFYGFQVTKMYAASGCRGPGYPAGNRRCGTIPGSPSQQAPKIACVK